MRRGLLMLAVLSACGTEAFRRDDPDPCAGVGDADGDGVCNDVDVCAQGDAAVDDDGDGTPAACDLCLGDETTGDADRDGVCNDRDVCDGYSDLADADADGVPDGCDACAGTPPGAAVDADGCPVTNDTDDTDDTGETGDTSETGETGDTSETGETGDTSETGETGDTSVPDDTGDTSDSGCEPERTDVFIVPAASAVDVLFVVDNSASMQDLIDELSDGLDGLIAPLFAFGETMRFAVTTTSAVDTGPPSGFPVGAAGAFAAQWSSSAVLSDLEVLVGLRSQLTQIRQDTLAGLGNATEQPLDAIALALSPPRVLASPNAGFLRPDARLAMLVLTNEDDQSTISTADFTTFVGGLRTNGLSDATFSAISGAATGGVDPFDPFPGCEAPASVAVAPRVHTTIASTGGMWLDMCGDWAPGLRRVAWVAAGLPTAVRLTVAPLSTAPGEVVVEVCPTPQSCTEVVRDAVDGFTYNTGAREVRWSDAALPLPGTEVRVTYPANVCP